MTELTMNEIEAMCGKHLQEFLGDNLSQHSPIDIDKFLCEHLGINLCYRNLSPSGDILGLSVFSDMAIKVWRDNKQVEEIFPQKTVIIDDSLLDDKQIGRRNYTKAHEAVHGIINTEYPSKIVLCYRKGKAATEYERMVDKAAAKLLLPEDLVINVFYTFMGTKHVARINPLCNAEKYQRFCSMAIYLGVSKKALSLRLLQLGLIEKADYERPREFLNIYCEV